MTRIIILQTLLLCLGLNAHAQQVQDILYLEAEGYEFSVLDRGNYDAQKLNIFVQRGSGVTAIDFARSDYQSSNSKIR